MPTALPKDVTPDAARIAPPRVTISGYGLVSPLGTSAWQTFRALLEGRSIADRAAAMSQPVDALALVRGTGAVAGVQHASCDPSIALAEAAARQALDMASADPAKTLCYLGVSKGTMHALAAACAPSCASSPKPQAPSLFLGPVGHLVHELRRRLGLVEVFPLVAACASSLTALHLARLALLDDRHPQPPQRVLVLTSEAALLPVFVHSYRRLGVLPPLHPSRYAGRPLDQRRNGFMLAEQAAAVVLERCKESRSQRPGAKIANPRMMDTGNATVSCCCFSPSPKLQAPSLLLLDTAIAAEGHDLMQSAPGMPALRRVAQRLLTERSVDVLHPHATGTPENDEAEMAVYADLLAPRSPTVYACKGALGHGLGAAGLVSLVLACLCARTGRVPPMPWLGRPIDNPLLGAATRSAGGTPCAATTHAIFAAGFGGHVAGAIIGDMPS